MLRGSEIDYRADLYVLDIGLIITSVVEDLLTVQSVQDLSFDEYWEHLVAQIRSEDLRSMSESLRAARTFLDRSYLPVLESMLKASYPRGVTIGYQDTWRLFRAVLLEAKLHSAQDTLSPRADEINWFIQTAFHSMGMGNYEIEEFLQAIQPHLERMSPADIIPVIRELCLQNRANRDARCGTEDNLMIIDFQYPQQRRRGVELAVQDLRGLADFLYRQWPLDLR